MRGAGVDATGGCTTAADAVAVDMAASVADVAASDRSTGVTTTRDMPQWRTRGNLHLDLNPWTYNAGRSDAVPADTLTFDNLR
jgi:hypothetical protein